MTSLNEHWSPELSEWLTTALASAKNGEILALDFDNTCIEGDTGELFHLYLSEHLGWHLPSFVQQIAPEDGQDLIVEAYGRFELGDPSAKRDLFYALMDAFPRRIERVGAAETYAWALSLHAGIPLETHRELSKAMLKREGTMPLHHLVLSRREGEAPLTIRRGIRTRPAFQALIANANQRDVPAWIVSATNQWTVAAAAEQFGISEDRIIGNRNQVVNGIISTKREGVTTYHSGKVSALEERGLSVALACGDSWSDVPMMEYARYGLLVDRGDAKLRAHAISKGWAIVPAATLSKQPWGRLDIP